MDWGVGYKKRKIIYFAGRLNKTVFNAIDPVLEAARYFQNLNSELVFVICGSGQYENLIISKFKGVDNVILPGEVSSKQLAYLRSKSYLAIQPIENRIDYRNSLSNKFFEYISSGLPILTSLSGITKEVIESNDIGFSYPNAENLIQELLKLESDPALRGLMSANAYRLFLAGYSSNAVYEAYSEHCEKIVNDTIVSRQ